MGAPSVVAARGAEVEKRAESAAVVARVGIRAWERARADNALVGGILCVWSGVYGDVR